jgi:hypothetical protein
MSNLIDSAEFTFNEIVEFNATDFVEGAAVGASFGGIGLDNQPHQQLANRTAFLYNWASGHPYYAVDTGSANNINISLSANGQTMNNPISSYNQLIGVELNVLVAQTSNSPNVLLQANNLGQKPVTLGAAGLGLDPGAAGVGPLRGGRFAKFMYDGTSFQLLAAPPSRFFINVNNPPGSDIFMYPGDEVTHQFSNVASVPMKVQIGQGIYESTIVLTASNSTNSGLFLQPNNTVYSSAFNYWSIAVSDYQITSVATSPPTLSAIHGAFVGQTPLVSTNLVPVNPFMASSFRFDTFYGPNGIEPYFGNGAVIADVTYSTFTSFKCCKMTSGVQGGSALQYTRWADTSTAWTSLGTWAQEQNLSGGNATISGYMHTKRLV